MQLILPQLQRRGLTVPIRDVLATCVGFVLGEDRRSADGRRDNPQQREPH